VCLHLYASAEDLAHVVARNEGLSHICLCLQSFKGCECHGSILIQWLVSAHTVHLHLMPCVKEMSMSLHFRFLSRAAHSSAVLVCIESSACVCICLNIETGRVSSYVGMYHEHSMFQHVCLHVLRAGHVSACVSARIKS
jgi:hypothetical protein